MKTTKLTEAEIKKLKEAKKKLLTTNTVVTK